MKVPGVCMPTDYYPLLTSLLEKSSVYPTNDEQALCCQLNKIISLVYTAV